MTAYLHANTLREGANTSERPRPRLFIGIAFALLIELPFALAILAWRLAL